jgi:phenylalanyl-tRNA synthetase beta chain
LYGGLETVALNIKHRNMDLRLFEFGNTYKIDRNKNIYSADSYKENRRLMLLLTGSKTPEHWNVNQAPADYYQLKAYVNKVFERMGVNPESVEKENCNDPIFTEAQLYKYHNQEMAKLGSIDQEILEEFEIEQPVFFADLDWDLLLRKSSQEVKYTGLNKYPSVRRDLALIVDIETEFESIRQLAFNVERKLLKEVSLFDVFESDKLGMGKKSYAVSFIIQDEFKTLTDQRVDKLMANLLSAFEQKLGARLR